MRGQAAFALGQLAAHCQPEAGRAAREALPAVIALMRDPDATVQQQACYALEALCEHMGADTLRSRLCKPLSRSLLAASVLCARGAVRAQDYALTPDQSKVVRLYVTHKSMLCRK